MTAQATVATDRLKTVLVLGGDGFCGWPTALHLSTLGHRVVIVDNLSRRRIDAELGVESLTPIASPPTRINTWYRLTSRRIDLREIDIADDFHGLRAVLAEFTPDTVVHFAEQRAAPYSMKSAEHKTYTVGNNVQGTHNLLAALVDLGLDTHVVHLGTMGVSRSRPRSTTDRGRRARSSTRPRRAASTT